MDSSPDDDPEPDRTGPGAWTDDFVSDLITACTDSVAKSNALPVQSDYTYYDAFPAFRSQVADLKAALLSSITQLIGVVDRDNDIGAAATETDRFRCLTEATDMVLERVDMIIHQTPTTSNIVMTKSMTETTKAAKQSHRSLQDRPQDRFKEPVDNSTALWRPAIRPPLPNHHTSTRGGDGCDPVAPSPQLGPDMMSHIGSLGIKSPHPYKAELQHLVFADDCLRPRAETIYKSLDDTDYSWVETEDGLRQLADALSREREFAVDLEHHNFRSYLGFTCLMQISTRSHDYVIDTLQLRHCMHLLLDPFTDPAIVKVFHGADYDVCWLQKDFSLFVVNMFDTGQAARVLQLPSFSLKYLLDHYCDVQTSKAFQRADWRLRPIPAPMIKYARSDTHYLLFIYDRMCNQLCEKSAGALLSVYDKSRKLCLKMFEKPVCHSESYVKLIQQFDLVLDQKQELALRNLYCWRDKIARELDESCGYILPNAVLISICKAMPSDQKSLFDIVPNVSPPVRKAISEVLSCIAKAAEDSSSESSTVPAADNMRTDSSEPKVLTLNEASLPVPAERSVSSDVPKAGATAVAVELACRSSSRMFDSDSDDGSADEEDVQAAEDVKRRILQALKPITTASNSVPVASDSTVEVQQDDSVDDAHDGSEPVGSPEADDESGQVAAEDDNEPAAQMATLLEEDCDEKASSVTLSLNEIRFGRNSKRKPEHRNPSGTTATKSSNAEPFDYQKAIESAASSSNDTEAKASFDFFRGPMIKRGKRNYKKK